MVESDDGYGAAFSSAVRRALAEAGRQPTPDRLRKSVAQLLAVNAHQARLLLRNKPSLPSPALVRALLRQAETCRSSDVERAQLAAERSRQVAAVLRERGTAPYLVWDLEAQSLIVSGNLHRLQDQLQRAERAFGEASRAVRLGSGDPLLAAELAAQLAALKRDQRHFDEALRLLEIAERRFRRAGDLHQAGRVLLLAATTWRQVGQLSRALACHLEAADLLDFEREPGLRYKVLHNLVVLYEQLGQPGHALLIHAQLGRVRDVQLARTDRLREHWLEGWLLASLGAAEQGRGILDQVRRAFLAEKRSYDAALVTLDLARLCLQQGLQGEVRRLVGEMLPVFAALEIEREAREAVSLFLQAAEAGRLTPELIGAVRAGLGVAPASRAQRPS
ncbi:MAG TPA: hypothetical protein VF017_20820 [Thermoanaerobaculia bacterium]|nr:hypothetical protein [Thermoanaerobaculia bacterium]